MNTDSKNTSPENQREDIYCLQTPPTPAETLFIKLLFLLFLEKHNMVWDEFHTQV